MQTPKGMGLAGGRPKEAGGGDGEYQSLEGGFRILRCHEVSPDKGKKKVGKLPSTLGHQMLKPREDSYKM
jgi:hypothetical protein